MSGRGSSRSINSRFSSHHSRQNDEESLLGGFHDNNLSDDEGQALLSVGRSRRSASYNTGTTPSATSTIRSQLGLAAASTSAASYSNRNTMTPSEIGSLRRRFEDLRDDYHYLPNHRSRRPLSQQLYNRSISQTSLATVDTVIANPMQGRPPAETPLERLSTLSQEIRNEYILNLNQTLQQVRQTQQALSTQLTTLTHTKAALLTSVLNKISALQASVQRRERVWQAATAHTSQDQQLDHAVVNVYGVDDNSSSVAIQIMDDAHTNALDTVQRHQRIPNQLNHTADKIASFIALFDDLQTYLENFKHLAQQTHTEFLTLINGPNGIAQEHPAIDFTNARFNTLTHQKQQYDNTITLIHETLKYATELITQLGEYTERYQLATQDDRLVPTNLLQAPQNNIGVGWLTRTATYGVSIASAIAFSIVIWRWATSLVIFDDSSQSALNSLTPGLGGDLADNDSGRIGTQKFILFFIIAACGGFVLSQINNWRTESRINRLEAHLTSLTTAYGRLETEYSRAINRNTHDIGVLARWLFELECKATSLLNNIGTIRNHVETIEQQYSEAGPGAHADTNSQGRSSSTNYSSIAAAAPRPDNSEIRSRRSSSSHHAAPGSDSDEANDNLVSMPPAIVASAPSNQPPLPHGQFPSADLPLSHASGSGNTPPDAIPNPNQSGPNTSTPAEPSSPASSSVASGSGTPSSQNRIVININNGQEACDALKKIIMVEMHQLVILEQALTSINDQVNTTDAGYNAETSPFIEKTVFEDIQNRLTLLANAFNQLGDSMTFTELSQLKLTLNGGTNPLRHSLEDTGSKSSDSHELMRNKTLKAKTSHVIAQATSLLDAAVEKSGTRKAEQHRYSIALQEAQQAKNLHSAIIAIELSNKNQSGTINLQGFENLDQLAERAALIVTTNYINQLANLAQQSAQNAILEQ